MSIHRPIITHRNLRYEPRILYTLRVARRAGRNSRIPICIPISGPPRDCARQEVRDQEAIVGGPVEHGVRAAGQDVDVPAGGFGAGAGGGAVVWVGVLRLAGDIDAFGQTAGAVCGTAAAVNCLGAEEVVAAVVDGGVDLGEVGGYDGAGDVGWLVHVERGDIVAIGVIPTAR